MAEDDPDRDEEWFKEVYGKEYTGPLSRVRNEDNTRKRAAEDSDEDLDDKPDPNAVPTDFTSREARVWEAKAKAIERNWKRRKEEELYCKICGEAGHFAQGCPTTLGGGRKSGEVVEKLQLKDKRLKPRLIGTGGSVIQGLEKETGCKLRLEDNPGSQGGFYVRVSGSDKYTVSKAINVVKKLVEQVEDEWNSNKRVSHQKSGGVSHTEQKVSHQKSGVSHTEQKVSHQRSGVSHTDHVLPRPHHERISQIAPNGTGRGGKPSREEYTRGRSQDSGAYSTSRNMRQDMPSSRSYPETLEELEHRFHQEAMELSKEQSIEEDREITRHRECLREIQEQYQQKMMNLRAKQSREREEYLQRDAHIRQQYYHQQQMPSYNLNQFSANYGYGQPHDYDYEYSGHHRKPQALKW